ncbi:hypothetical protein AKJ49_00490 [candidate division MSBL1 archaeon SCGC-AAA382A03]|uniref:Uncharacterized protein n=1 Tax=candidate division MSBL1 archaeon SCGC-AAA382A03 TaxID=1698278 RepID=A0A133VGL8_9EURY|nr:hypothetical protein AKJ49_00490 [candidate division MSBL1 archaeon SCGC-AAA382A03]
MVSRLSFRAVLISGTGPVPPLRGGDLSGREQALRVSFPRDGGEMLFDKDLSKNRGKTPRTAVKSGLTREFVKEFLPIGLDSTT